MPKVGLEPTIPCERQILSLLRIPFRHLGSHGTRRPVSARPSRLRVGAAAIGALAGNCTDLLAEALLQNLPLRTLDRGEDRFEVAHLLRVRVRKLRLCRLHGVEQLGGAVLVAAPAEAHLLPQRDLEAILLDLERRPALGVIHHDPLESRELHRCQTHPVASLPHELLVNLLQEDGALTERAWRQLGTPLGDNRRGTQQDGEQQ